MNLLTPHHHLTLHIVTPVWPGFYGVSGADQGAWNGRNKSEVRESLLLSSHLLFLSSTLPSSPCPLLLSSFCPLIPSFHPLIVPSSYPFHPSLLCPLILSSPRPSPSPVLSCLPPFSGPRSLRAMPATCSRTNSWPQRCPSRYCRGHNETPNIVAVITKRQRRKFFFGLISWSKEYSLTQKYQKKKVCRLVMTATISRFSLSKDELFPLFSVIISEYGKIILRFVLTSTIPTERNQLSACPLQTLLKTWLLYFFSRSHS